MLNYAVRYVKRNGEDVRETCARDSGAGDAAAIIAKNLRGRAQLPDRRTGADDDRRDRPPGRRLPRTVYNHFPDDAALIAACSSHWIAQHPRPDAATWAAIDDEGERLLTALADLYGWYEANETMLANSERDAALVPALADPAGAEHRAGTRRDGRSNT